MTLFSELKTVITGDASSFINATKSAERQTAVLNKAFGLTFAALAAGAATVGALGYAFSKVAGDIGGLYDQTQAIGIEFDKFTNLRFAAEDAGVGTQSLVRALSTLQVKLGQAAIEGSDAQKALKALGLSFTDIAGLSIDKQYSLIASKIALISDKSLQAVVASKLLGRAGKEQIGLIRSGVDEAVKKYEELGYALTTEQAAAVDNAQEAVEKGTKAIGGIFGKAFAQLSPNIEGVASLIDTTIKELGGIDKVASDMADAIRFIFANAFDFVQATLVAINRLIVLIAQARIAYFELKDQYNSRDPESTGGSFGQIIDATKDGIRFFGQAAASFMLNETPAQFLSADNLNRDGFGYSTQEAMGGYRGQSAEDAARQKQLAGVVEQYTAQAEAIGALKNQFRDLAKDATPELTRAIGAAAASVKKQNANTDATAQALEALNKATKKVKSGFEDLDKGFGKDGKSELQNIVSRDEKAGSSFMYRNGVAQDAYSDEIIAAAYESIRSGKKTDLDDVLGKVLQFTNGQDTRSYEAAIKTLGDYQKAKEEQKIKIDLQIKSSPQFLAEALKQKENKQALDSYTQTYATEQANGVTN